MQKELVFPKYGTIYEVRGGPDIKSLSEAYLQPGKTAVFTLYGIVGGEVKTHEVEVQLNELRPFDPQRNIFYVSGSVVTPDGMDMRISIQRYNAGTGNGSGAGIFQ